jgi:EF-P beta-lysylation protein EpmB
MIPVSSSTLDSKRLIATTYEEDNWQKEVASSFKTVNSLLSYLNIDPSSLPYEINVDAPFSTRITPFFANLIQSNQPFDPILLQVLPRLEETIIKQDYSNDPLNEESYSVLPGLIHKYSNRVLLVAHQSCAIHCRYCFRQHFPYSEQRLNKEALDKNIEYIKKDSNITEVILSGGDPLNLSDEKLKLLLSKLDDIPQLTTIRIHTRTPVVSPSRLTSALNSYISTLSKQVVFVFHINHSQEISVEFEEKLQALKMTGSTIFNQSVLLKDINNSADTLITLSEKLFEIGILPYYLHQLDPVNGTHHFKVSDKEAREIWHEMQTKLSGYLLPRLVQEIPNKPSKTWINSI